MPTSAALNKEKSIVCCSSICNYRTMLYTIHFLSGPPTCLRLSTSLYRCFFFHFCPSSSVSPLSSSLFHSLSFLLSQCNVIQDRCWQPQLWHCNLRSALVARQPVWDRARWCTSFFLQKKGKGEKNGVANQPAISQNSNDYSKLPVFRMGLPHICSAVEHIVSPGAFRGAWNYSRNTKH